MGFHAPLPIPLGIADRPGLIPTLTGIYPTGSATYSVWLRSPTGVRLALIENFSRLEFTLTVNTVGIAKINFLPTFPLSWIQEDSQLEIWRKVPGGQKYLVGDTIWFVRDWDHILTQRGQEYMALLAYPANMILDTPIIDYASGTAYAKKTDYIDDMMKGIIRENRGALATDTDRDITDWMTVELDLSLGPSTTKSFSWRNVLTVLRELAQEADDAGTPVFFDVIYTPGVSAFQFRTFINQRGIDHSSTGGKQVILSPRNGTLSDVRRSYVSSIERNAITVGGAGEAEERALERDTDDTRIALSPFNRREIFIDARNTGSAAAMQAEGATALKNYRPRQVFTAKVRDAQAVRLGREYRFGDRVIAEFHGQTIDCRLDSLSLRIERGKEDIKATLRADE